MVTALTETAINAATRRATETGKRLALPDPGHAGLQLRITPKGVRTWVLYCFIAGKPRRFVLGQYPALGLAQARRAADAMRERVRQGADPIAEARERRAKAQAAKEGAGTLAALLTLFERQGAPPKSWPEYQRRISYVFAPHLKTPLAELRLGALQMQADRWPAQQSARAAVRYLVPILKWAAAPGRAYVAKDLTELAAPATVRRRQRVVSRAELAALLPVLRDDAAAYGPAMRFMLLTLARREEVGGACWREIDLERALWTIPSDRTKSDRPHVVPLSRQAIALLRAIRPAHADPDSLVFATATGGALGNWDRATKGFIVACKLGSENPETGAVTMRDGSPVPHRHDLRRTAATLLGEMGVEPHIVEAALNHAHIGGQLAATYNTARYRPQVATALQLLADALDGIERGSAEIVPLVSSA